MIGGQATRTWISRAPPNVRRRSSSTRIVVERTMESSTRNTRLPARTSRSGVYFVSAFFRRPSPPSINVRPAVAIADQAFHRLDAELEGHRIGRRLARVRHGDHDRVLVQRHAPVLQLQPRQFHAQLGSGQVDAAVVERAGHVGEINPLEEAMGPPVAGREPLDLKSAVGGDGDRLAGQQRLDILRLESQVQQGHALAGTGEQRPFLGIHQRFDPQRIAGHQHVALGIQEHQAVRPVKAAADVPHHFRQRRPEVARQLAAQLVHQDLGVALAGQVVIGVAEQSVPQFLIIRQLAVEAKTEPLVLDQVVPLEGLGEPAIVRPAGGVTHVADRRAAGVFLHQRFAARAMRQAEHLGHRSHVLVRVDQLVPRGIVRGHSGGQLAAILDVQQHPRDQTRRLLRPLFGTKRADFVTGQVVNGCDTAFVV